MLFHLGSCRGFKVWDTVDSRHDPHLDGVGIPTAMRTWGSREEEGGGTIITSCHCHLATNVHVVFIELLSKPFP